MFGDDGVLRITFLLGLVRGGVELDCSSVLTSFASCHRLAIPLFAGRLLLAAIQADWRSATGVEDRHSLAPQVLGELSKGVAFPAGRTRRHARLV